MVPQIYSFVRRRRSGSNPSMAASAAPRPALVAAAGLLSLAAAMGIGRFAFTPLLPLMAREGRLDLAFGGWIAAANYAGYLVGALSAGRVRLGPAALATCALTLTALLTAAMALPWPPAWLLLRFAAGIASAWVFVATSVWCLGALARTGPAAAGGWVYAGVGAGIALTGLDCLGAAAAGLSAPALWLQLGGLALALMLPVLWVLRRLPATGATVSAGSSAAAATAAPAGETRGLVVCYGVMGFGYILPATFLPALARSLVDDPRLFGLAWPLFGATAAVSTVATAWLARRWSRLRLWAASQLLMGVGVLLPGLWLGLASITLSALLVGGTFMVITLAGVQEMRERAPAQPARWVARITAAFALGQIAGPAFSSLLLKLPGGGARGLPVALLVAGLALLVSGAWLWRRSAPLRRPRAGRGPEHARSA
jgi:MFS family permease